jgi:hypothetical protein
MRFDDHVLHELNVSVKSVNLLHPTVVGEDSPSLDYLGIVDIKGDIITKRVVGRQKDSTAFKSLHAEETIRGRKASSRMMASGMPWYMRIRIKSSFPSALWRKIASSSGILSKALLMGAKKVVSSIAARSSSSPARTIRE